MSSSQDDIRVRIAGDLADINKAIQELRKEARAAGRDAEQSGRGWSGLGRTLDGLKRQVAGVATAYLSFRGVSALIRGVINSTAEQEAATAQLNARLQSTQNVIGLTADELLRMARGYEQVSQFSRADVINAESVLLTYTQIGQETFPRAMQAALDFATAMRVDLSRAAETVGKALGQPTKAAAALADQGFTFTGEQRRLIRSLEESGRVAEAQAIVLGELELAYSGAARAARDTLGGALAALQNSFRNLLEGKGGSGGLNAAREAVEGLIDTLERPEVQSGFDKLTSGVFRILGAGATVLSEFGELGDRVGAVFANLTGQLSEVDRIESDLRAVDRGLASIFSRPIQLIGKTREEMLEMRRELERQLQVAKRAEAGGGVFGPPAPRAAPAATSAATPIPVDPRPALKAMQAQLAAAGTILRDELKRVGETLDRDFADNLVRFAEYYRRRAELERQAIDQQLQAQRVALQLLDEEIRLADERGDAIQEQENKRKQLVADITVLEQQRAAIAGKAARDQADAEKALAEQLDGVRARLLELQGDAVGARTAQLQAEFKDLLERLAVEGDVEGQALVQRLFDVELARTKLSEIEAEYERTLAALQRAEQRVETQVQTGVISEREGRREIIDLHKQTAAELERLLPLMRELAEATGDPAAIERLKDMELEVERLGATVNVAARELKETFRDAGEGAFADIISGAAKADDAISDFISSVRRKISQLISERLFDQIFGRVGSGGGSGGGLFQNLFAQILHDGGIAGRGGPFRRIPDFALAGAPRFHTGGLAPNEQVAILERGEEVLTRRDPRHIMNGGGTTLNLNVTTSDARSFRRASQGTMAAELGSMLNIARNRNQ